MKSMTPIHEIPANTLGKSVRVKWGAWAIEIFFCLFLLSPMSLNLAHAAAKIQSYTQKGAEKAMEGDEENAGVFSTKYYTVRLPDDWKALSEPAENQGLNVAVFSQKSGNTMVTLMAAANHGESAKTIAGLFAEQFKSGRAPVEKNGQYTFNFLSQNKQRQAWISCEGDSFMLAIIYGNRSEAMDFIRKNISSKNYPGLLPR